MTAGRDFDGFYRDTHPRLWSFLMRTTGEADLAEEVAQEAFVRLLGSRGANLPPDERRAYVFRIARNLVRDAARRRARERTVAPGSAPEAAALGIAAASVKVLLHRARNRFRDRLGEEDSK